MEHFESLNTSVQYWAVTLSDGRPCFDSQRQEFEPCSASQPPFRPVRPRRQEPQLSKPPSPRHLSTDGIKHCSASEISRRLELDDSLLPYAFSSAVSKGSVPLTACLLATEHAPVETPTPLNFVTEPSVELLILTISTGKNPNQRTLDKGAGPGPRLLDLVVGKEDLARWCLEQDAQVSDTVEDEDNSLKNTPLTEKVAALGTVSCLRLLLGKNARLGRRTLHRVAESAASRIEDEKSESRAMLRFLVKEQQLDVNLLVTGGQPRGYWGTPIVYALKEDHALDVIL